MSPIDFMSGVFIKLGKMHSRKGLYPFLMREFAMIPNASQVLNVGAGGAIEKILCEYSASRQFEVISLDIDSQRNPDIVADLHEWNTERKFDVVVLAEVLEHCHTPQAAIGTIRKVLKPEGKLILTTPFIFPIHDAPYDYHRFTYYGLTHLLSDFENVKISARNSWTECVLVLLVRLVMDKSRFVRLVSPFFIIFAFVFWPIAWVLSWIVQTDFITTGYCVKATAKGES